MYEHCEPITIKALDHNQNFTCSLLAKIPAFVPAEVQRVKGTKMITVEQWGKSSDAEFGGKISTEVNFFFFLSS